MKVFAISDLHLSINNSKPMDIFGPVWDNYFDKIVEDWRRKVSSDDIVLLAGDLSWAMRLDDAKADINLLKKLPGKKILIRGNHDYWWGTISKVRKELPNDMFALQNDAIKIGNCIFCGTRGWLNQTDKNFGQDDKKILDREIIRLEMSLQQAKKLQENNEKIFCLIHFPPFDKNFHSTPFTDLMEKYGVSNVIYGHLHGKVQNVKPTFEMNGVKYFLTSCDLINNKLIEII